MAKRGKSSSDKSGRSAFDKFHVLDFDDRARREFTEWESTANFNFSSVVVKLCESGWKISLSYSDTYSCFFGSLTDKRPGSDYYEHTFAIRHADYDKLTRLLQFAYQTMLVDDQFRLPDRSSAYDW